MDQTNRVLTISVGNTRTRAGIFAGGQLVESAASVNADEPELRGLLTRLLGSDTSHTYAVLASVNDAVAERVAGMVGELTRGVFPDRIGRDVTIPIQHSLDQAGTVGQDRWLNAIAAHARTNQACVIVDAGTAVTVDFIDGQGAFHGGVIFPGLRMMLRAMHEFTAALPSIEFLPPDADRGPLGKDTAHAMTLGVLAALRGGVRAQVERCADYYGAYPQVIATGGDAPLLEEEDGIIEHIVPDLTLIGMHECVARQLAETDGDE
ncbi:MAG: type III pantothenate kinase [Leptolyngbya sp. PLA3]|nr:MAG: type III pantothenate kinase [Cyanobacteria bacterium CYA]MCE7968581.1 type III pantothenate kinase [Leptolyngbya sp. PL-A3]